MSLRNYFHSIEPHFEKGGKLATQLFQLYEYCRQQLLKGFTNNIYDNILKAINSLNEIFINEKNGKTQTN